MQKTLLFTALLSLPPMLPAETVRSLDKVRGQIESKEIAKEYEYEMGGKSKPDGFGYLGRADKGVKEILSLLAPDAKLENIGQVSLKEWKGGRYIAVVCQNTEAIEGMSWTGKTRYDECQSQYSPKGENPVGKITIALLKRDTAGKLALAAEPYSEQYDYKDEKDSQYRGEPENPQDKQFTLKNHTGNPVVGDLDRLDFANYKLNDNDTAFGVRYIARVMYSGGGAFNQAITLFAVIDGKLKPVFKSPTYQFADIAGDWNKDGTRQHDVDSAEYVLSMGKGRHDGFNDIVWRQAKAKRPEQKTYRWDAKSQYYK